MANTDAGFCNRFNSQFIDNVLGALANRKEINSEATIFPDGRYTSALNSGINLMMHV